MNKHIGIKSKISLLLLLFGFSVISQTIIGQNIVKGTVFDSDGIALPGVTVYEKNSSKGTVTNFDGNYEIGVASNGVLVFSYTGFISQEVEVGTRSKIDMILVQDETLLNEVVVVGYTSQLKEDVSGSVAKINVDDLTAIPQVSVDQLIQGRAAGVTVTQNTGQPGGAVSIKVRGVGSINASTEPLYIIDGIPFSSDVRNIAGSGRSFDNSASPLSGINPNDIESINILKDASATAIYGSRGSNGVVIINTKKGKKRGGEIKFSTYTAFQQPVNLLPVLNLREYAGFQNELRTVFGFPEDQAIVEFLRPELLGEGTNWQREIFDEAYLINHQLSFSGSNEKTNYFLSTGYTDQEGIVRGSGFERISFRLNLDSQVKEKIKIGLNLSGSRTDEDIIANGDSRGVVALALRNNPAIAVFNPDGSFAGPTTSEEISLALPNPIAQIESVDNTLRRDRLFAKIYAEIDVFEGLKYSPEIGGNFEFNNSRIFQRAFSFGAISFDTPTVTNRDEKNQFWIIKNVLNYNKRINDLHNITALIGHEAQESSWNGVETVGTGFVDNDLSTLNASDGLNDRNTEYKGSTALESYFGQAFYSYDNRYNISASIRADGSSNFTRENRWGYFPSISAAWKLSNESFMENFSAIQDIKIYGGYGEVGNQSISPFSFGSRLNSRATDLGTGFLLANFPNPDLKWETSKQVNLGLDFSLFKGHFNTTIEVYRKLNSDFLFQLGLTDFVLGGVNRPGSIAPPWVNLGEMENKGIDVTLNFDTFNTKDFSWNSTVTFSHYKNEVLSLVDGLRINGQTNLDDTNEVLTQTRVGDPIGVFYGYQVEGLFRSVEDFEGAPIQFGQPVGDASIPGRTWLGDIKFKDVNNDGVVDANDRTAIGSPHPDFTFSWQNNFRYKNFELGIFLQGSYGNDVFNAIGRSLTATNLTFRNQLTSVTDYWTPQNPNASHPRYTSNATSNIFISDRYIEDGSYLRIQNVRLGYTLPKLPSLEKIGISKVGIYGSIQNLHTFTNYSGYDPEVGALNQDPLLQGVDNGRYPLARTFTFGLDLVF